MPLLKYLADTNVIGDWMGWVVALLADGVAGFAIFLLIGQTKQIKVLRQRIDAFIRDE